MNRREFLKAGVAAAVAVTLPVATADAVKEDASELRIGRILGTLRFIETEHRGRVFIADGTTVKYQAHHWDEFNPDLRRGNGLLLTAKPTAEMADELITTLYEDMVQWIPPTHRKYIKVYGPLPVDYGRSMTVSWYYEPVWKTA
ncbi:MAG: hypothetical protein GY815_15540 [Gammaproteobacteria bacterium]|nr:hypothetical protein [Gammaproteobacteria bacterium]